jgi:hypothetical protein
MLASLPLTWGDFTVQAQNTHALLQWRTLQERNTALFTIEHAVDGSTFTAIGQLKAAGNSALPVDYTFTHLSPVADAINYYRLKQADTDGKISYSGTRTVKIDSRGVAQVTIVSNPVRDYVQLVNATAGTYFRISDMNGRIIISGTLSAGANTINSSAWGAGIYTMSIYNKNKLIDSQRLLKL